MHPILFHLGRHPVPTFAVLAVLGLVAALALSERTAKLAGLLPEQLLDAAQFAAVAAFVVTRVLLIAANWKAFLSAPLFLVVFPSLTPLGMLLTTVATILWLRFKHTPALKVLDAWAPCATLLWCFLALGHFAEGSDPGLPTLLPWATRLPRSSFATHPVALYAALIAAAFTFLLWVLLRRKHAPGRVAGAGFLLVGVTQFLLTFLRQPGLQFGGLDWLQWTALVMLTCGGVLLARSASVAD